MLRGQRLLLLQVEIKCAESDMYVAVIDDRCAVMHDSCRHPAALAAGGCNAPARLRLPEYAHPSTAALRLLGMVPAG
jgi:hypothetical protein